MILYTQCFETDWLMSSVGSFWLVFLIPYDDKGNTFFFLEKSDKIEVQCVSFIYIYLYKTKRVLRKHWPLTNNILFKSMLLRPVAIKNLD